ncbi:MAG: DUF4437 domain-containing protein [Verrucomicrobiales bacterium]|nr:DUF4437 domain-containing protein [Verrucomicrobiales bacterium]
MKTTIKTEVARKAITAGLPLLVLGLILSHRGNQMQAADRPESKTEIVLTEDVEWTPLNPARGDKGPKAGTLWGDRAGDRQTGFLVKFADGFSSPPHIHNITYRGVVISGLVHNDDPGAEKMWMPPASFWTQPAGEVHITAAKGADNMAYIEIERGPYLVLPSEEANDNGERPVNVHESNLIWLSAADTTWIDSADRESSTKGPWISHLWGKLESGKASGTLLKLPVGFEGEIQSNNPSFRVVVIEGYPQMQEVGIPETTSLEPGNYFGSKGASNYRVSAGSKKETILYIRTDGSYKVSPKEISNQATQ